LGEQGIHILVQRSPSVRRRGFVFGDFHGWKQSRRPAICQLWSGSRI
jgi:hypothetical protein